MDGDTQDFTTDTNSNKNYSISGRVMLTSVIVCFIFCLVFLLFFLYYRTYYATSGRSFSAVNSKIKPKGLSPSVIKSLPTFFYSSTTHDLALDCAVCLAEFQENQSVRILPKCNHVFHIQCIDTWFVSHSDCPLCRTVVQDHPITRPGEKPETTGSNSDGGSLSVDIHIAMEEVDIGSGSGSNELEPT